MNTNRGEPVAHLNDRDAAGLRRPGITVQTAPGALVTSPFDASVRFVGRLDGYGSVVRIPDIRFYGQKERSEE